MLGSILMLLVIAFSILMIFKQEYDFRVVAWGKLAIAGLCFWLPSLALISMVYGRADYREVLQRKVLLLGGLFGLGLVFSVLLWRYDYFWIARSFPNDLMQLSSFGKYFLVYAFGCILLALIHFENTVRALPKATSSISKQLVYVFMAALLFAVYAISQMLMYARVSRRLAAVSMVVTMLTSLFVLFYLVKYGLKQWEINIGRDAAYSSVMIFVIGVYFLVIGVAGKIVHYAGGSVNLFLTFLLALIIFTLLLVMLVSESVKKRLRQFVDRNFYRNRYDYREQWEQFSDSLTTVLKPDEILSTVLDHIAGLFQVEKVAILWQDEATDLLSLSKAKSYDDLPVLTFERRSQFINWLHRWGQAIETEVLLERAAENGLTAAEREALEQLGAVVCVPMIIQQKLLGILVVGPKSTGGQFRREDLQLLETLANQSSVAILNAKLAEELAISREMASFHKWSSFVLHDLKNSVAMLSLLLQNAEANWTNEEFQQDLLATITQAVDKMKKLIGRISSLPERLMLNKRPSQINEMIQKVIQNTGLPGKKQIHLISDLQPLPAVIADAEQLEKVIQNLVINAVEALPNGGQLKISTAVATGNPVDRPTHQSEAANGAFVSIAIADTGVGMSEEFIQKKLFKPFQTTKKKGLGIGLYQCREIILAHGGTIQVKSQLNQGSEFKILLPIGNGHADTAPITVGDPRNELSLN
ncbi:MAG: PEP-CTERM system histidine kinase PrsK, partial [candidate division KSB1 bacterium]|nr:PEP-CTERM system histidine kinase PrsK [candidate division KSB1 bacterium]